MLGVQSNLCQTPVLVNPCCSCWEPSVVLMLNRSCWMCWDGTKLPVRCVWLAGCHSGALLWHMASPRVLVAHQEVCSQWRLCHLPVWCQSSLVRSDKAPFWWRGMEKGMYSWTVLYSSWRDTRISEVLGSEAYQTVHGKSTSNCMTFVTSDLLNEKRQTHKGVWCDKQWKCILISLTVVAAACMSACPGLFRGWVCFVGCFLVGCFLVVGFGFFFLTLPLPLPELRVCKTFLIMELCS